MTLDPAFEKKGANRRSDAYDLWIQGQREHKGTLDFGNYCQAMDKRYLGFQGSLFLGRSYGNDSSNAVSVLNGPGYRAFPLGSHPYQKNVYQNWKKKCQKKCELKIIKNP